MHLSENSPLVGISSPWSENMAGTSIIWMWSLPFSIPRSMTMISIWPCPKAGWKDSTHLRSLSDYRRHFTVSYKHHDFGTTILTPSCTRSSSHSPRPTPTSIPAAMVFWCFCTSTLSQCCTQKTLPKLRSKFRPGSRKSTRSPISAQHANPSASKSTARKTEPASVLARRLSSPRFWNGSTCRMLTMYQLQWILMWS